MNRTSQVCGAEEGELAAARPPAADAVVSQR